MEDYIWHNSVDIPIYGGVLVTIFSDSVEQLKTIVPEFWNETIYAHAANQEYNGADGYIIILNPSAKDKKLSYGAIAHEALHIVNFLADNRGFKSSYENDEPNAYLIEWVINEVSKAINQAKKDKIKFNL